MAVKTLLPNFYSPSAHFAAVKMALLNHYRMSTGLNIHRQSTGIAVVTTGMTILYGVLSSFVVVRTGLGNIYSHSTGFAVVLTGLLNIYKPSTISAVAKTGLFNFYRPLTGLMHVRFRVEGRA